MVADKVNIREMPQRLRLAEEEFGKVVKEILSIAKSHPDWPKQNWLDQFVKFGDIFAIETSDDLRHQLFTAVRKLIPLTFIHTNDKVLDEQGYEYWGFEQSKLDENDVVIEEYFCVFRNVDYKLSDTIGNKPASTSEHLIVGYHKSVNGYKKPESIRLFIEGNMIAIWDIKSSDSGAGEQTQPYVACTADGGDLLPIIMGRYRYECGDCFPLSLG